VFKAKEYQVEDSSRYAVRLGWQMPAPDPSQGESKEISSVVFPGDSTMNLLKVITFRRKGPFALTASYADDKLMPAGYSKDLGKYTIEVPAGEKPQKVKVRTALTLHGTFTVQGAHMIEDPAEEGDATNGNEEAARKRRKIKRTDLEVKRAGCPGLAEEQMKKSKEQEDTMIKAMQEVIETDARKNDLESYILTMRSSVAEGGKLAPFIKAEDSAKLAEQLQSAEDWLYDHLDDPKEVFIAKLAELKVLGGPAEARQRDEELRPELIRSLEETISSLKAAAQQSAAKKSIADNAKIQGLETACNEAQLWLTTTKEQQAKLTKLDDSALSAAALEAKIEELKKLGESTIGTGETAPGSSPTAANGKVTAMELD